MELKKEIYLDLLKCFAKFSSWQETNIRTEIEYSLSEREDFCNKNSIITCQCDIRLRTMEIYEWEENEIANQLHNITW